MKKPASLEEDKKLVNELLTEERNLFLVASVLVFVINLGVQFYNFYTATPETLGAVRESSTTTRGLALFLWAYFAFRLSRFLQLPRWKIAVYTILMLLPLFYIVSFISLLREIKIARRWVNEQATEEGG